MGEENQSLEVRKKQNKNWVFLFGLGLFLVCIVVDSILYFMEPTEEYARFLWGIVFYGVLYYIGSFALLLIFIGLILFVRERRNRLILAPIALLIYLLVIGQISQFDFLIATPFEKIAKITERESFCGFIPIINGCGKGQCYSNIALIKKDELICAEIKCEYLRDFCYRDVSIAKKDLNICNKIKNPYTRSECLAQRRF